MFEGYSALAGSSMRSTSILVLCSVVFKSEGYVQVLKDGGGGRPNSVNTVNDVTYLIKISFGATQQFTPFV